MDEKKKSEHKWRKKQNLTFLFPLLLCGILLLGTLMPFIPSYRAISLADAARVLEELGYSPYDSTDTLCALWKDEAYEVSSISVDSDNLRLDLYQSDNALPIQSLEGILESYMSSRIPYYPYLGMCESKNYEAYLYQSEECAVMQIRLDDTVLFVEWTPDCKDRVLELLDALGYPGEEAMNDLQKVIWN